MLGFEDNALRWECMTGVIFLKNNLRNFIKNFGHATP